MRLFDTSVQELKYKVLKEVARAAFDNDMQRGLLSIPQKISPGPKSSMRCCIYKERAVVNERIKLALGGDHQNRNVVEVLNIACDECTTASIRVTESCRGCLAHRCVNTCPKEAITVINHRAHIDEQKCIECGRCLNVCPYNAIIKSVRPCENACKVNAISIDADMVVTIDEKKCIRCGACVYQCPFGAISDKSYILDAICMLKDAQAGKLQKLYAIVAPSLASQFVKLAPIEQVVAGLKVLGFTDVAEAALGADLVAYEEAEELFNKGFLTSSCCPAFVDYIEKNFPDLKEHISHNPSPMIRIAQEIKKQNPEAKIIFIGPCIAKKAEFQQEKTGGVIDCVLTFEELQALFDSRDINLSELPPEKLNTASYYGRIFARSGGLTKAVEQALIERKLRRPGFFFKPAVCNGISDCRATLLKASHGVLENNFVEGMICTSGCIGGAACLTHGPKDQSEVDAYGREAEAKTLQEAVAPYLFNQ